MDGGPASIEAAEAARPPRRRRRSLAGCLCILPAMALMLVFFVAPAAMTGWMSLQSWPLLGVPRFIGIGNYLRLWSDAGFWASLRFTALYTLAVTVAVFGAALPLAFLIERPHRLVGLVRSSILLPMSLGLAATSLLWIWLLNADSGLLGPALQDLGVTAGRVDVLGEFDTALLAIVVMVVWKVGGFVAILLMAGLQAIPVDIREAARMDHANALQRLRYVILPLMRPTLNVALCFCVTGSMLAFDQFYIMTAGGPRNQTVTVVFQIFNQSFVSFRLGYGAAMSVALLAVLLTVSVVQFRWLGRRGGGL